MKKRTSKIIKYPARSAKVLARLPALKHKTEENADSIASLQAEVQKLSKDVSILQKTISGYEHLLHSIDDRIIDVSELIKSRDSELGTQSVANKPVNNTVADNHDLDRFYKQFEDKFRGSEGDIIARMDDYKDLFSSLPKDVKKKPIVDIGCGRGEFLSFAKKLKLKPVGVDMNKSMVDRAVELGYDAVQDDAISYLSKQKKGSIGCITGFHIVEHIPFESLMELFGDCYRTITPGGFALFETPNPNNIVVGSSGFYMDPSHIKPIPPELLAFAMESVGFKCEILRLHPVHEKIEHTDEVVKDIMGLVYGARDYAVIARKI